MPHAKTHSHRRGQGKTGVHALTRVRAGPMDYPAMAKQFVNPFDTISLVGFDRAKVHDNFYVPNVVALGSGSHIEGDPREPRSGVQTREQQAATQARTRGGRGGRRKGGRY